MPYRETFQDLKAELKKKIFDSIMTTTEAYEWDGCQQSSHYGYQTSLVQQNKAIIQLVNEYSGKVYYFTFSNI